MRSIIRQVRKFTIVASAALALSSTTIAQSPRFTGHAKTIFDDRPSLLALEDKISTAAIYATESGRVSGSTILLADQADLSLAYSISDHDARGWYVYHTLTSHAELSQAALRADMEARGIPYRTYWAANMIVAELDRAQLVEIAGRSDVARIDVNRAARWLADNEILNERPAEKPLEADAIEWGVSNVRAPQLWAMGHTGQGIVVGGLDTGIRWTHNAIKAKYRGWNGTTADHNYNWYDAVHTGGGVCGASTIAPCDDNGHGSHTLGTMVGDDGGSNRIGVAPGAKWIGCRNMNQGDGTPESYTECFQFMIAPTDSAGNNPNPSLRPHILNNSWGCPASEGCTTRAELEVIVNNTQAAGIFVQSSAGNTGGAGCSSVSQALAIYDATFAAGAIDATNALSPSSSRGPSTFYTPNLLKPNITAPGVSIRSMTRLADDAYSLSSGTSMASPHVAGVVALLWSARPHLVRQIAATKKVLQDSANPGVSVAEQTCGGVPSTQIPNNSFGYGRVDALAAFETSVPVLVNVSGRVLSPEGAALRNVAVYLYDANGIRRTATTSSFGIFTFEAVAGGDTSYTLTAISKRYRFAPKSIVLGTSDLATTDFIGLQ